MQVWDNSHEHKLIDLNTEGTVTAEGPAGSVKSELLDDEISALTFDIARYDLKLTT
jgi:hypothetical protein